MPTYISSIGTAVPRTRVSQKDSARFMSKYLPLTSEQQRLLRVIYRASGIQYRHSVISDYDKETEDFEFFPKSDDLEPFPTVSQRMDLYKKEASNLCLEASRKCLGQLDYASITHLITVSCTGMYAPGIDIELIEHLGLATDIQRTSINFMGCYAAFNAIKVANEIINNNPDARILIVAVELCTLHLSKKTDEDNMLSNALFGDGAAALLLTGSNSLQKGFEIQQFYSDLALNGKHEMSWHIGDFGFEMRLSANVPSIIQSGISALTQRLLKHMDISIEDIQHYAIHPGGRKILEVIEHELGITSDQNHAAYTVMKNYGNMSSPTVLFVLHQLMQSLSAENKGQYVLSFAFGPGLTLESMLLKVV